MTKKSEPKKQYTTGRPTTYKEEYCDQIIEHLAQGFSMESFAATINCSRDSLYEWRNKHKSFSDSIKIGLEKSLIFWEKIGQEGTLGKIKGFNCATYIFSMKNKFRWTDRTEAEITHSGNVSNVPQVVFKDDDK